MAKRINLMAPYFVQMRELERQLILGTLTAAHDALHDNATLTDQLHMAASFLGVQLPYLRVRMRVLGGILEGDPKHEPPTVTATKAWSKESVRAHPHAPRPKKPKLEFTSIEDVESDA